ncbi:MAG TPA: ferrous iron transport protein A [Acholeplasmataceae bacterium]|nr:ferrous iron transport protein A [Acholeplasmataceae bacterium]
MSDLRKGQKGRVLCIRMSNPALRRRLFDMGITKEVEFEIKKISPLGDPIDIVLRGYELCIRKSCMEQIDVEVLE